jgi:hypothetical protein
VAEEFSDRWSGHRVTVGYAGHHFARYGWDLVGPDGVVAVNGTDFVEFDGEGKLLRIVGFFGPLDPVGR